MSTVFKYSKELDQLRKMGFQQPDEDLVCQLNHFKGDISQIVSQLDVGGKKSLSMEELVRMPGVPVGLLNVGNSTLINRLLLQFIPANLFRHLLI